MTGPVLVVNAGSSSIKTAVFDADLTERLRIAASGIGGAGQLDTPEGKTALPLADHTAALRAILDALRAAGIALSDLSAAGHRVVHGGTAMTRPARLEPEVREAIAACIPLAPLHNPRNLAAIDALAALAPDLPQVACFDTAFHATNPEVARRYALPTGPETEGLRRYGFHGLSYAAMTHALPRVTGAALPDRLLALHLGNGASLCAIRGGRSVATTMGYSPVSGLTMGTRVGEIDALAVLELAHRVGSERAAAILNGESGLKGLSGGASDMRALAASDDPRAGFARQHFCYWAVRHAGSMIAAMGGLDAMAFTGGIGENDAEIRDRIAEGLRWAGDVSVHVVPAEEERHIARETLDVMKGP